MQAFSFDETKHLTRKNKEIAPLKNVNKRKKNHLKRREWRESGGNWIVAGSILDSNVKIDKRIETKIQRIETVQTAMLKSYPVERTRGILILFFFNKKITDINDS